MCFIERKLQRTAEESAKRSFTFQKEEAERPPQNRQLVAHSSLSKRPLNLFLSLFTLLFFLSPSLSSATTKKSLQQGLGHLRGPVPQARRRPGLRQRLLGKPYFGERERRLSSEEQQLVGVGRERRRRRGKEPRGGPDDDARRRPTGLAARLLHEQRGFHF